MRGPILRRSQDYGETPPTDVEDFLEMPTIDVDLSTEELNKWLDYDANYVKALDKLALDTFKQTNSMDAVTNTLISYLQKTLVDGALKLSPPYQGLALIALEDVDWDNIVKPFATEAWYGGPEYLDEEEAESAEFESLEHAIQEIPDLPPPSTTQREWAF